MTQPRGRLQLLLISMIFLTACNSEPVTKAGAALDQVKIVRLLLPEAGDPEGLFFAAAVQRRSSNRIRVEIDSTSFNSANPASETKAVGGVGAGRDDLGFLAARSWAEAGDAGFQALMAPFSITTVAATIAVAQSVVATDVLDGLTSRGVIGLSLIPGEPRQLLTRTPIFGSRLVGARIRIVDNTQTEGLIAGIGGVAVAGLDAGAASRALTAGTIDGLETSPIYALANAYHVPAQYLAGYGLMPKYATIVAGTDFWKALPTADRKFVTDAAADTQREAAHELPSRLTQELGMLCAGDVVVDELPAADLAALAAAGRTLRPTGPRAASVLAEIETVVPPGRLSPLTMALPPTCLVAHTRTEATTIRGSRQPVPFTHRGGADIPPGTYVTVDTVADFRAGGVFGHDWDKDIVYTWKINADGTLLSTQDPDYPDQGPIPGSYVVDGDTLTITYAPSTGLAPEIVKWSYFQGELTFAILQVLDANSRVIFLAHPWRRTG